MHLQVLVEADVPGDSLITYVAIPRYLYWKFRTKGRRYYVKFNNEVYVLCIHFCQYHALDYFNM